MALIEAEGNDSRLSRKNGNHTKGIEAAESAVLETKASLEQERKTSPKSGGV